MDIYLNHILQWRYTLCRVWSVTANGRHEVPLILDRQAILLMKSIKALTRIHKRIHYVDILQVQVKSPRTLLLLRKLAPHQPGMALLTIESAATHEIYACLQQLMRNS